MFMKGGGSQNGKPTCATFGKKNYEECLVGTSICFGCGKDGHKVRDCPNIASREKEDKKVDPNVPKEDAPTRRHFYTPD